jgi:hypothetical protein
MEINIVNTTIFADGIVPFDLNSANHRLHFRYQNNRICSNKQRMSAKCARKYISTILYFLICSMDRKPQKRTIYLFYTNDLLFCTIDTVKLCGSSKKFQGLLIRWELLKTP